jgi:hypothetical protein
MKFFISYSRHDKAECKHIVDAIQDRGCDVSFDGDIEPGAAWSPWIEQEIETCDCFVALLSAHSAESKQCGREWEFAVHRRQETGRPHILPLRVGKDAKVPQLFANTHVADQMDDRLPELIRQVRRQLIAQARDFWGQAAFRQPVQLVVATRELRGGHWKTHAKVPKRAKPEGPRHWLAAQDVRAAVHLTNAVSQISGHGIVVLHDHEAQSRADTGCTIALGLGFNQLTYDRMKAFEALYRIKFGRSKQSKLRTTDHFSLGKKGRIKPQGGWDVALLARVVLPQPDGRRGVHFICAGRTAHGTAAAGYFLAERWPELANLYRNKHLSLNADSIAVALWHRVAQGNEPEIDTQVGLTSPEDQILFSTQRAFGIPPVSPTRTEESLARGRHRSPTRARVGKGAATPKRAAGRSSA